MNGPDLRPALHAKHLAACQSAAAGPQCTLCVMFILLYSCVWSSQCPCFFKIFSPPSPYWELSPTAFLRRGACENDCGRPRLFLTDECLPQGTFSSTVDCTPGGEFPRVRRNYFHRPVSRGSRFEGCSLNPARSKIEIGVFLKCQTGLPTFPIILRSLWCFPRNAPV